MLITIQDNFLTGILILLALCITACLVAAVRGPSLGDRIVAGNMTVTLTVLAICVLSYKLSQGWLVDVALIYAMISFLAVVVLTKIFIGQYRSDMTGEENEEEDE